MAHYAKVLDGKVVNVIRAESDFFDTFIDNSPGEWIQTSRNTWGGVHYNPDTKEPDDGVALRYNHAHIGFFYDRTADAFYPPQPYPSWTLNTETYQWECPVTYPDDGVMYNWNEETQTWDAV